MNSIKRGKINLKKDRSYIFSLFGGGVICLCFLIVLYAVKGFFPFGSDSVAVMDMCHGYVPVYYHLYDFLHGDKSLFFDFYSGTGVNMVGVAAVNGLLSPFNLLFYLVPRDFLLQFLNIFLIIKIVAAAITAGVFFTKRFPNLPCEYSAAFSVLYALSGYVLLYYMHIIWLDVIVIFPLLCYFCEKVLRGGNAWGYSLCLSLSLLCSFYLGVMVVMAVFFVGGAYLFTLTDKKNRASAAVNLGVGTLAGGLLPMFVMLPGFMQMRSSARYGFGDSLTEILGAAPELNIYKTLMFYGLGLAAVFIIILFVNYKKHIEKARFALISLLIMFLPLVIEGSAALWHFGSYKDFPYRFGFIAVFLALSLAASQIAESGDRLAPQSSCKNIAISRYAYAVAAVFGMVTVLVYCFKYFGTTVGELNKNMTALIFSLAAFALGAAAFWIVCRVDSDKIRRISVLFLCALQLFPFAFMSVGGGSRIRYERPEHDVEYVSPSLKVGKLLSVDGAKLERVHNPDMSLNINYGFVAGKPALSNWTHQIPASLQSAAKALGYSTTYTLLLDGDGTVFSDAVLNMKQTVSKCEEAPALYSLKNETDVYKIYDNIYTLPTGLLCGSDIVLYEPETVGAGKSGAVFENQNRLFSALGGSGKLIRTPENDSSVTESKEKTAASVTYKLKAEKNEVLYFTSLSAPWGSIKINVNGKAVKIPSYHKEDNETYSAEYNNNCTLLGVFNGETVEVRIDLIASDVDTDDFAFGFLSLDKMNELSELHSKDGVEINAEKSRISIKRTSTEKSEYVFLPIAYDSGWKCTVNGAETEIVQAAGSFMAVELPSGAESAELKFTPSGLAPGILLSLAGSAIFAALVIMGAKKKELSLSSSIDRAVLYLFGVLWVSAAAFMYIIPAAYMVFGVFTS